MSYDNWKMTEPYDPADEDTAELATCPHCDRLFVEDEGGRLGSELICPGCFYSHPAVVGGVMAALAADERSGK